MSQGSSSSAAVAAAAGSGAASLLPMSVEAAQAKVDASMPQWLIEARKLPRDEKVRL